MSANDLRRHVQRHQKHGCDTQETQPLVATTQPSNQRLSQQEKVPVKAVPVDENDGKGPAVAVGVTSKTHKLIPGCVIVRETHFHLRYNVRYTKYLGDGESTKYMVTIVEMGHVFDA
ncbi:hypothetical protein TNCV_1876151 [Trichonephila clavipes]|nr:hypothetical protein TNCV_1876151 [Trichonephila clavipes]